MQVYRAQCARLSAVLPQAGQFFLWEGTMDFTFVKAYGTDYAGGIRAALAASSFSGDNDGLTVFPGFCDVHVHFREPGFSYKETIRTGSLAAAAGGYTAVCPMPNLNPVPDSREHLDEELAIIRRDAVVGVFP